MKIIAGKFKGRNFYMPADIRPTPNIIRKALFDLLGQDLKGVEFLDLFAGSGAVGLEAFSRGARRVTFVEKVSKIAELIQENLRFLDTVSSAPRQSFYEVLNMDAFAAIKLLARQEKKFDIVFSDPPYGGGLAKKTLNLLLAYDIFNPHCTVIIQHEKREILPEIEGRFLLLGRRKYGGSILSMYTCQVSDANRLQATP
jgi:16S rRNA (guanine(966)-N(2))-methyltransferase RsmD